MPTSEVDNPSMNAGTRTLARLAAAVAVPFLGTGCVLFREPQGLVVSSDPVGASVQIDGRDTGFVTPCVLELDTDEDQRVDVVLDGYRTETRWVTPDHEVYAVLWREMSVGRDTWDFPLFLNFRDFFVPVKVTQKLSPGRIHVRLDRAADVAPGGRATPPDPRLDPLQPYPVEPAPRAPSGDGATSGGTSEPSATTPR